MNILAMGLPLWRDMEHLRRYKSHAGHEVRHLAVSDPAHYHFAAHETAAAVIDRIAREWPPDMLICFCPEFYPPPREVEHCPVQTAAVISDWNLYQPQLAYNLARFDVVLTDRLGSQCLRLEGATPRYFEPLYAHRALVHRRLNLPRDVDIMFLGNLNHAIHRRRGRILERVAALSEEYRVFIAGEFTPEEYARHLNRARIVVNHAVRREMNLRCFEATACGALLFQEADNLEAHDWLEDGKHAVFYTEENITGKLRYYLEHEEARARIADQGWRRSQELAAERRMDRLFDWISRQPRSGRRFLRFSSRTRALAEVMLLASSQVPAQAELLAPTLERARADAPDDVGLLLAAGCVALSGAGGAEGKRRGDLGREAIACFHEATRLAPEQAVPWINLAIVIHQAGRAALAARALEMAVGATGAAHGGFMLGKIDDPYYADWRLALACGEAEVSLLHGLAACRLALLALEDGRPEAGCDWARRSIEAYGEVARPYRFAAIGCSQVGDFEGAARYLEAGLGLTAFDADYRMDLVTVYNVTGRREEARKLARASARIFRACPDKASTADEFADLSRHS